MSNPTAIVPFSIFDDIAADCGIDLPAARARAMADEITDPEARFTRSQARDLITNLRALDAGCLDGIDVAHGEMGRRGE